MDSRPEEVKPIFEWDPRKDSTKFEKHGIGFSEGTAVFGDPLARIFADEDHRWPSGGRLSSAVQRRTGCCW